MNVINPFHRLKFITHANTLRGYVLEKAAVDTPASLKGMQVDGQLDRWMDRWIDGWMDRQMNGQMDGWIYGGMDE